MRRRWVPVLMTLSFASACDKPPAAITKGPAAGILRATPTSIPPELAREAAYRPGLPSLCLKLKYSGPKPALRVRAETFDKGASRNEMDGTRPIDLPFSAELALAIGEDKNAQGEAHASVIEMLVTTEPHKPGVVTRRAGSATQMVTTAIGSRKWTIYQATWPLEIPDGQEPIAWAVFVGEPADVGNGTPLLERAARAEAAWLFRISSAEKPKE